MLRVFGGLNEQMLSFHEILRTCSIFPYLKYIYIYSYFLNVANLKCVSTEAIEYCIVTPTSQL